MQKELSFIMNRHVVIPLSPDIFQNEKLTIFQWRGFEGRAFKFASGIAAFELIGPRSHVVILPFMGHQIWRASVDGVELGWQSMFDEPVDTASFLETYGAFFIHCGLTRTGAPTPEDAHPLHGELPLERFSHPRVLIDTENRTVTIEGRYHHRLAFYVNYEAVAAVTISETPSCDISLNVTNNREEPMELMYLAHANFNPVDGSELVYSAPYTPEAVTVRSSVPSHISVPDKYRSTLKKIAAHPELHHKIHPGFEADPVIVFLVQMQAGNENWAHAMQRRPDGSADLLAMMPQIYRWRFAGLVAQRISKDLVLQCHRLLALTATLWKRSWAVYRTCSQRAPGK